MYLNAACGSSGDVHFIHKISQTQIQSDGTWSLRATLLLPCTLKWKWRADDRWELAQSNNREVLLSASTSAILSTFNSNDQEGKNKYVHCIKIQKKLTISLLAADNICKV